MGYSLQIARLIRRGLPQATLKLSVSGQQADAEISPNGDISISTGVPRQNPGEALKPREPKHGPQRSVAARTLCLASKQLRDF